MIQHCLTVTKPVSKVRNSDYKCKSTYLQCSRPAVCCLLPLQYDNKQFAEKGTSEGGLKLTKPKLTLITVTLKFDIRC